MCPGVPGGGGGGSFVCAVGVGGIRDVHGMGGVVESRADATDFKMADLFI